MRRQLIGLAVFPILLSGAMLTAEEKPISTLPIGAKAPEFNLQAVDGPRYSLKDFANARIPLVVCTCNHCPTAQSHGSLDSPETEAPHRQGAAGGPVQSSRPVGIILTQRGGV